MNQITPSNPAKITLKNIKRFFQGWLRYIVYKLSKYKFVKKLGEDWNLLKPHEQEQFKWRLTVMNQKCLENEACIICGCQTPQLQMSEDACEGKCYPAMMNKEVWEQYKKENNIII